MLKAILGGDSHLSNFIDFCSFMKFTFVPLEVINWVMEMGPPLIISMERQEQRIKPARLGQQIECPTNQCTCRSYENVLNSN